MNDNFPSTIEFVEDQLVVDLPHKELVKKFLLYGDPAPTILAETENPALDLALLTLGELDKCAELIEASRPREIATLRAELTKDKDYFKPIDAVLFELRARLGDRFSGWRPALGKNRMAGVVFSTPGTQGKPPVASFEVPVIAESTATFDMIVSETRASGDSCAGEGVTVGILDTPVFAHPDLAKGLSVREGAQVETNSTLRTPESGHGTFVTGLVRAHAPAAEIVVAPGLGDDGLAKAWDVGLALAWFIDHPVDVLNLSFACRTVDDEPPLIITRAIEKLAATTVVVAAAGNHGADLLMSKAPVWPAALPGVVAVGARDERGSLAQFTPKVQWVRCVADGVRVLSTYPKATVQLSGKPAQSDGFARWSGTSFAAATVSGAIAARTSPTRNVTARDAARSLLAETNPVVKGYTWPDNS